MINYSRKVDDLTRNDESDWSRKNILRTIEKARETGLEDLTAFFVASRVKANFVALRQPGFIDLGKELLQRLIDGEEIDPIVVFAAAQINTQLGKEVSRVPVHFYKDHLPSLFAIATSTNKITQPARNHASARLAELHRTGTRLTYEQVSLMAENECTWDGVHRVYFKRIQSRRGIARVRRMITPALAAYTSLLGVSTRTDDCDTWDLDQVRDHTAEHWRIYASMKTRPGTNKLFRHLMERHLPFPNEE